MIRTVLFFTTLLFVFFVTGCCQVPRPRSIPMSSLSHSATYSSHAKKLIAYALALSKKRLNYRYGSSSPRRGGMDCSGTINYVLKKAAHIKAPRDARDLYLWVKREGHLHPVHAYHFNSPQFDHLKPGDLLFWTGTYHTRRKPPITHVMMYLGKDKHNRPLMFGATMGTCHGRIARGVGVFDFTLPSRGERARFVGYGCIPAYTCTSR